jgi:hypothetical protein
MKDAFYTRPRPCQKVMLPGKNWWSITW